MDNAQRRARLDSLAQENDGLRRKLIALGILTDQLKPAGLTPVLVGGTAVEFYTAGGYATKDVDLALPTSSKVDAAFAELGFRREGRFWVRDDLDLLFEAPAGNLAGEDAPRTEISIDGWRVVILGIEDLILDRLRAAVHWKSEEDMRWARRLVALYSDCVNWDYLRRRAESRPDELQALNQLVDEAKP